MEKTQIDQLIRMSSRLSSEQVDQLMEKLSRFYGGDSTPAYFKEKLVDCPFDEGFYYKIIYDLNTSVTPDFLMTKHGEQLASMIRGVHDLMCDREMAIGFREKPEISYSDIEDSIVERRTVTEFTSDVISNIDTMKQGDVRRSYNYSAQCSGQGDSKDVMFSQYVNGHKEDIVNVNYDKAEKKMAIDVKTIPQRLSQIAMKPFEKIMSMINSITTAAEKSLQVTKSRISVKFPNGFKQDFEKIPMESITKSGDRYYISLASMDVNDVTNLFARSQKFTADIGRVSNIKYELGSAKDIIRDAFERMSRNDNPVAPIQLYMVRTTSQPNLINGNEQMGSLCIELHDPKLGNFKAYVPLLEEESIGIVSKIKDVNREMIYQRSVLDEERQRNREILESPEFQRTAMDIAHLVNASINGVPYVHNPRMYQYYIVNKAERGFISGIETPRELIDNLVRNEAATPELRRAVDIAYDIIERNSLEEDISKPHGFEME